jgi:hypothetical protein
MRRRGTGPRPDVWEVASHSGPDPRIGIIIRRTKQGQPECSSTRLLSVPSSPIEYQSFVPYKTQVHPHVVHRSVDYLGTDWGREGHIAVGWNTEQGSWTPFPPQVAEGPPPPKTLQVFPFPDRTDIPLLASSPNYWSVVSGSSLSFRTSPP